MHSKKRSYQKVTSFLFNLLSYH